MKITENENGYYVYIGEGFSYGPYQTKEQAELKFFEINQRSASGSYFHEPSTHTILLEE